MNQELTTEQKARVFSIYFGHRSVYEIYNGSTFNYSGGVDGGLIERVSLGANGYILRLRPLSTITDEDAVEIAKMFYKKYPGPGEYLYNKRREQVLSRGYNGVNVRFDDNYRMTLFLDTGQAILKNEAGSDLDVSHYQASIFQFLIQQGYAIPLFYGVGHSLNGKNAIEIGLAIDSTK